MQVAFWSALGGVALLLSFGKHLPVYQVFYLLAPGWRLFRQQERTIVWTVLAIALLAGYGAAWLTRQRAARQQADPAAIKEARLQRRLSWVYVAATLAALAAAVHFFALYQAGSEQLWGFTAATLFLAMMLALSGPLVVDPFPPLALLQIPLADQEPFRIANEDVLPTNYGVAYGLEEIDGASPLRLARWQTAMERLPQERLWALLNVRYVLSRSDALEAPAQRVAEGAGLDGQPAYLHRLTQPSARAWLAEQVLVEPDEDRLWQRLADASFDLSRQVLLPALPTGWSGPAAASDAGGSVVWRERLPEHLALDVTSPQPAVLVLSELSYPGWRVTVDGAAAPLLEANGLLRAVALEAGAHQVELTYRPASVTVGLALSTVTLLAVVVGLALLAARRRR